MESYKNLGVLALGVFWFTTVCMIRYLKGDKAKSISEHVASSVKVGVIFGAVGLLSSALLGAFFIKWFTPTFHLGLVFNSLIVAIWVLFGIAGIVPDKKGYAHKVHINAALLASILLIPAMLLIVKSRYVGHNARLFTASALFFMIYIAYQYIRSNKIQKKFLIYEALYFLCCDLSILIVTYTH